MLLKTNDRVQLTVKMKVGEPSEYVEVEDEGLTLHSESADLGTTIGRRLAESVPLNGRSFQSLIALAPGVIMTRSDATNQGQFSVNGQRASSNYFLVDGVSANFGAQGSYSMGGAAPATNSVGSTASLVSIDGLQEINVKRAAYSAEFGRGSGGQISVTTRSGTNRLNGSIFEYFRNDALDANDWFANANGVRKPPLRHNDFGGVVGGPIDRDRTFFFFSYEGLRLRQPRVVIGTVPSIAVRESGPASLRPLLDAYPLPTGANVSASRARYYVRYADPGKWTRQAPYRSSGDKGLRIRRRTGLRKIGTPERAEKIRPNLGGHTAPKNTSSGQGALPQKLKKGATRRSPGWVVPKAR